VEVTAARAHRIRVGGETPATDRPAVSEKHTATGSGTHRADLRRPPHRQIGGCRSPGAAELLEP